MKPNAAKGPCGGARAGATRRFEVVTGYLSAAEARHA